jgi:peptidyl-prolyl cis-trans isomerase B (cyclophilin B)
MAHSVPMSREDGDELVDDEQITEDEPSGEEHTKTEEDSGVPTTKQRRATAKRKLERQLERRAKQARRRLILTIAAVVAIVAVVAGLAVWKFVFDKGASHPTASSTPSSARPSPTAAPPPGGLPAFKPPQDLGANCQYPATPNEPAAKPVEPPRSGKVPTDEKVTSVSITTNQGPLGVHLNNAQTPCTVNNFVSLAQKGFFNDTHCHRLTNDQQHTLYVLQCGDPKGDGSGGPGYQFANEYPTNQYQPDDPALDQAVIYPRGTLAMANNGSPGTNGSQFFIVYKDSTLPPTYTVFGTVDPDNLATLDKITAAGTADGSPDGKPKVDVTITTARVD